MVPACRDVNLRTGTTTSAAVKVRLSSGTLTVTGRVKGSAWRTDCSGPVAGSTWSRISHVDGNAVSTLYGVPVLYAASGVLKAAPTTPPPPPSTAGMTIPGATVTLFGRGWGHGVGLSQYGARGRAFAGQDAATILAHYYPGTTIGSIPTSTAIRVLLVDDLVPTAAAPLAATGRGGPWTIDGIAITFPADARLRLVPAMAASVPTWSIVVDDATGTVLHRGPAPADLRLRGTTTATTFQLPAASTTYDRYRGSLRIIVSGARVDVVNELPLETYLRGVVPMEIPSAWPVAARTAQTIAARSYAAHRVQPGVGTFDVYADTRSQVYRGLRAETGAANTVIAATSGQVLRSGSTIVNALFHSTGGGATESNENVYVSASGARVAGPVAYLRGSSDRDATGAAYDAGSPYATWKTKTYTLAQLSTIFAADPRTNVGTLQALDLRNRGVSGRLISVTLVGSAGAKTVSGGVLVAAFNANRPAGDPPLRSTLLDVAPVP
jgi:stage II sporulation protein D